MVLFSHVTRLSAFKNLGSLAVSEIPCSNTNLSLNLIIMNSQITQIYQQGIRKFSLVTQMVKNLPGMQGTRVQSGGQEDPLEKETASHSSILAWKIPWTEKPGRL